LLPEELTISRGELTPTLKVRRAVVDDHYAQVLEQLYGQSIADRAAGHAADPIGEVA
jgi:long-subunit acyl-CoA synthetase (AMP-forming)